MVDAGNSLGGVYFRQTDDIVFPDGINWNPIGSLVDLNHAFAGVYDGNGHTLSNIYSEDQYAGVFSLKAAISTEAAWEVSPAMGQRLPK